MKFYVRGRGEFPFDMLRYDACYPAGPDDAANLSVNNMDHPYRPRTVCLYATGRMLTPDRWASFGWSANEENIWEERT